MVGLIVHEWFAKTGGSEQVVEQMLAAHPDSTLQVLWNDRAPDRQLQETWLANTPLRRHKALSIPFQLPTWRYLEGSHAYDWMLVSSHAFAHHARVRGQADLPKYVYAHTPARYVWAPDLDHRGGAAHVKLGAMALKPLDRRRAQEAHFIAANSEFTRERIRNAWRRDAEVIYPPVDVARISTTRDWSTLLGPEERALLESLPDHYLLGASRMVSYKRLDRVIQAGEATGAPVVIAGSGPLWSALELQAQHATVPVRMLRRPSDALLFALYQRARAFVFPAVEDFGIMPVEAMAAGVPVIVPSEGGAAESAKLTEGGVPITDFEPRSWRAALSAVDGIDRKSLPTRAERFSNDNFRRALLDWIPGHSRATQAAPPPHEDLLSGGVTG